MKKMIVTMMVMLMFLLTGLTAQAQSNKITGKVNIKFSTRVEVDETEKPMLGIKDVYTFENFRIMDKIMFNGKVEHLPTIIGPLGEKQASILTYKLDWMLINPANPTETTKLGSLSGGVPIDKKNVYHFDNGTLENGMFTIGDTAAFNSAFKGEIVGKPPTDSSLLDKAKKQIQSIKKQVNGKLVKLDVADWDKVSFNGFTIAKGPLSFQPEVQVNGEMLYDRGRDAWSFLDITMNYSRGKPYRDVITGNIRWVKSAQYDTNGESEYQFDIRLNEKPADENAAAAVFKSEEELEAAYFTTDPKLTCLTGTVKFKDTKRGKTVVGSEITYNLTANNMTFLQAANIVQLLNFSTIQFFSE